MILKIAIVDDEQAQTDFLSALVKKWALQNKKDATVKIFKSGDSFHFEWLDDKSFDILLLDIQMSGINGIELARKIRKTDEKMSIIFITGLSEYMGEGYDVSALHYLLKPINQDKLFECLDKACKKIRIEPKSIIINSNDENIKLMQEDIIYAEAFAHTVIIHTQSTSYEVKISIGELEKELDQKLVIRCHRSYLAGLKYISKIDRTDLLLDSGKAIPISRRLYQSVNQAFISYYRGDSI